MKYCCKHFCFILVICILGNVNAKADIGGYLCFKNQLASCSLQRKKCCHRRYTSIRGRYQDGALIPERKNAGLYDFLSASTRNSYISLFIDAVLNDNITKFHKNTFVIFSKIYQKQVFFLDVGYKEYKAAH